MDSVIAFCTVQKHSVIYLDPISLAHNAAWLASHGHALCYSLCSFAMQFCQASLFMPGFMSAVHLWGSRQELHICLQSKTQLKNMSSHLTSKLEFPHAISLPLCCASGTHAKFGTNAKPIWSAGWKAILLTWAWALSIWQIADFAKYLASSMLQRAEDIQIDCKHTEQTEPAWVKAVNLPGVVGDYIMRAAYKPIAVRLTAVHVWSDFGACLPCRIAWTRHRGVSCEGAQSRIVTGLVAV